MNDEIHAKDESYNNGGKTDYYAIPTDIKNLDELFIHHDYNFSECIVFHNLIFEKDNIEELENLIDVIKNNKSIEKQMHNIKLDSIYECKDFINIFEMNFNIGEAFKSIFCLNKGRHSGTTKERELNKIIYYIKEEIYRLKNLKEFKMIRDDILKKS